MGFRFKQDYFNYLEERIEGLERANNSLKEDIRKTMTANRICKTCKHWNEHENISNGECGVYGSTTTKSHTCEKYEAGSLFYQEEIQRLNGIVIEQKQELKQAKKEISSAIEDKGNFRKLAEERLEEINLLKRTEEITDRVCCVIGEVFYLLDDEENSRLNVSPMELEDVFWEAFKSFQSEEESIYNLSREFYGALVRRLIEWVTDK